MTWRPVKWPVRKIHLLPFGVILGVAVAVACSSSKSSSKFGFDPHADPGLSDQQYGQILNAVQQANASVSQAQLAAQGQQIFESKTLGKKGDSCSTCHVNGGGVNMSVGIINHPTKAGDFTGPRTPIMLWGAANTGPYTWDGHVATLEKQVTNTIVTFTKAGATQPAATTAQQVAAVVAYLKTLTPPHTDFDRATLSPLALRGEQLFRGSIGCANCHSGPLFTDNRIHDIGTPTVPGETDPGAAVLPGGLQHGFNTPTLRDVKDRAAFMHNGVFKSLADVLTFYDSNKQAGVPPISGPDKDAIIAYLQTL